MPEMAAASILPDIHYSVQVGQELMVDTNIQPDAEKNTKYFVYTGCISPQKCKDDTFSNCYPQNLYPLQHHQFIILNIIIIIIIIVIITEG